jgi:hypothetical protein
MMPGMGRDEGSQRRVFEFLSELGETYERCDGEAPVAVARTVESARLLYEFDGGRAVVLLGGIAVLLAAEVASLGGGTIGDAFRRIDGELARLDGSGPG